LRPSYRRKPYRDPAERIPPQGRSGTRRQKYLKKPEAKTNAQVPAEK
jgi:hypothetical protein